MGDLTGFVPVWFHQNGIANILSLAKVNKRYRVTYESNGSNAFKVHKGYGEVHSFVGYYRVLFYLYIAEELRKK